jgi:hypothetical protein
MDSSTASIAYDASAAVESNASIANVAWTSLTEAQAGLAQRSGGALRYRPEFALFSATQH